MCDLTTPKGLWNLAYAFHGFWDVRPAKQLRSSVLLPQFLPDKKPTPGRGYRRPPLSVTGCTQTKATKTPI